MRVNEVPAPVQEHMQLLRRQFHQHPELAFEEVETARTIIAEFERLGLPYHYDGAGSGVIADLHRSDAQPTIALRADMDALPGEEETNLPFSSDIEGKVHACGHDAHMAIVLGAAQLIVASPPEVNVRFIFQPAEERGGGARTIIESGALDGVTAIFGGHVTQHYDVGDIMVAQGTITAQSDRFTIRIHGKGGHVARPHEATDAVVIAAICVTILQTLVSREVDPMHPSVVTVGQIEAGSAPNVIAESAILKGTIRTTTEPARDHIHRGIVRMAKALGDLHEAELEVEIDSGYPPVVNTQKETALAHRAATGVVGQSHLVQMEHPSMGAEDFAYYLHKIPGCYVRFGARPDPDTYIPLHSPRFDIDERVLAVGAAFFTELVHLTAEEYVP